MKHEREKWKREGMMMKKRYDTAVMVSSNVNGSLRQSLLPTFFFTFFFRKNDEMQV